MGSMKRRILVGCEFSGVVRDAFAAQGWDAWSCDLLPTAQPGQHYQGDVRDILWWGWDLAVFHPPCTYLANSGVSHLYIGKKKGNPRDLTRWALMEDGADFFRQLLNAPIARIAVENPVMHGYAKARVGVQQTQTIQPWQFGHMEQKATCLWLKGLPALKPTRNVYYAMMQLPVRERQAKHWLPPSADRWALRSETYSGIAQAMAQQWTRTETMVQLSWLPGSEAA